MIGRDFLSTAALLSPPALLSLPARASRGIAIPENCKFRVSVGHLAVASLGDVAKDLIISPVFLDDVDDVLDRGAVLELR